MSMPKWIDPRITVGNIITVGVFVVSFFVWGIALEARVTTLSTEIGGIKAENERTASRANEAAREASTLEKTLLTRLTRIETILDRIDKKASSP